MNKVQRLINPLHLEGLHHEADMMRNVDVHRVLYQTCGRQASGLAKSRSCQQHKDESERNQRLVIFDKDGTLVCIHAMWAPWIRGIAARLENATDLDLANKIFNLVSFDNNTGKIKPGLLGEGTMSQLRDTITQLLSEEGVPREKAERIVQACWQVREMANYGDVHAVGDVGHLFGVLKSNGYLIAVNTSDSRGVTEQTLDHLDLRRYVDIVVCGDDEDVLPKPHPSTAQKICRELGVHPSDVIMIGDSTSDMMLGCNAGFRYSIGVLTGIAPREVLERDATYVVDDIHQALHLILQDSS